MENIDTMGSEMDAAVLHGGLPLDPGSLFVLFITLCGFMLPIFILFPPVPPRKSDALLDTHTKLGVEPAQSGLKDQYVERPATSEATVKSIFVYPIKSCKGIEVARSRVLPTGLEFDRLFTFAQLKSPFPVAVGASDEEKSRHRWDFITIRQFPLLATVEVELWRPDVAKLQAKRQKAWAQTDAYIVVRFPWQEPGIRGTLAWLAAKVARGFSAKPEKEFILPVEFPSEEEIKEKGYTYGEVKIWNEMPLGLNMSSEIPPELPRYLGVSNKMGLFRVDPTKLREVYRCAPQKDEAGYQPVTGFQDAYPLHLISLSSVRDLGSRLLAKDENILNLDVRRFRANIIIDGQEAYEEESWKSIRIKPSAVQAAQTSGLEAADFHVSCRTVR
ncbi:putative mosc domain-containing protein [Phaeoacremonium minimum UCRPA7]|uniref:Putative mosc domain-containing protein n=1 Tax=Phaeoacremonium minimum (strain UCR-PA7) TaxID=1286976 RepID=R8BX83_PHAM7|nr:putative mosc domain-containing protein [Phaeoacremonium minimum UCRPA7]EOO04011.1 putative mosc domain-containing protein [Phaeoacremonium minimum UCRPA7]